MLDTLANLKCVVLPAALAERATWDEQLTAVGTGVASAFDAHCNRTFSRAVGAVEQYPAQTTSFTLRRYPIEVLTSAELSQEGGAWTDITTDIGSRYLDSGIIKFRDIVGTGLDLVRFTYTGGYWLDDGIATQPAGSTALPDALRHAWHLQCQAIIEHTGILRTAAARSANPQSPERDPDSRLRVDGIVLIPIVEKILMPYRRFAN